MAKNKLYILDTETGDKILLAKSMGEGWEYDNKTWDGNYDIMCEWFSVRDLQASYGNCLDGNTKLKLVCENVKK